MKNLRIGVKFLLTFMLIIILFCITVATAINGLNRSAEKYSDFYQVGYQVTNRVMNMRRGLQMIVKDLAFITITTDSEKIKSFTENMDKELTVQQENIDWLMNNYQGNREELDLFYEQATKTVALQGEIVELAKTDNVQAQIKLLNEYEPLVNEAVNLLIQISKDVENSAGKDFENTSEMQDQLVIIQLGMAAGALVITLIIRRKDRRRQF